MKLETLLKLRHKEVINLFDRETKTFIKIQFNHDESKFVCWEQWVSKDRKNWINHNKYLSLKDVRDYIKQMRERAMQCG